MNDVTPRAAFTPALRFTPWDWYWIVGGDTENVWSSKRAMSVPVTDQEYADRVAAGFYPTPIGSMDELEQVLSELYPAGTLKTYTVFKRWEKEQGGITTSFGMPASDREPGTRRRWCSLPAARIR